MTRSAPAVRAEVRPALTTKNKAAPAAQRRKTTPATRRKGGLRLTVPKETWEPIFFESINERARASKLTALRSSVLPEDDFEIRVWIGFGLTPLEGFVLRRSAGRWSAVHLDAAASRKSAPRKQLAAPKSGWETAWQRLADAGVLTLPDAAAVGCGTHVKDGMSYVVEVNKDGAYRTYMYDNPDESDCREAARMVKIGEIIADEYGLQGFRLEE